MNKYSNILIGILTIPMSAPPPATYRTTRDSDDDEEDDRKVSRGCTLQYQHAIVKVLTQFHTTSTEGTDQVITMLGPDWQVDITDLVQDSLKVSNPRVAELVDRMVLVGREVGTTMLKVGGTDSLTPCTVCGNTNEHNAQNKPHQR